LQGIRRLIARYPSSYCKVSVVLLLHIILILFKKCESKYIKVIKYIKRGEWLKLP